MNTPTHGVNAIDRISYLQVVPNTTTSIVAFSILSPDASLSYDRIKLRLEEYRTLFPSDSDTIALSTEDGKTAICRKQAKEMAGSG